jgi:hypothetical protein
MSPEGCPERFSQIGGNPEVIHLDVSVAMSYTCSARIAPGPQPTRKSSRLLRVKPLGRDQQDMELTAKYELSIGGPHVHTPPAVFGSTRNPNNETSGA